MKKEKRKKYICIEDLIPDNTLQTINFIEKIYKKIEENENTTNALDYIDELKTYLDITYLI